jgi:diacylglycerol kinase (ATP)
LSGVIAILRGFRAIRWEANHSTRPVSRLNSAASIHRLLTCYLQIDSGPVIHQHYQPVPTSTQENPVSADLLLVNPKAGGGRAGESVRKLRDFALQRNWNLEIALTNNADDLAAKAQQAAQAGRKRILVLGGDGTFQVLLNAVIAHPDIILGVIPAGGGNDLAASLGLPPDPIAAASLLLNGEVAYLDAVQVRTADGVQRLYVGGGGVGLDAEASRLANGAYRNWPGRTRYLLSAIRALFSIPKFRARITSNAATEESMEAQALLVSVLNTPSYGAGLYLAPDARTDDGILSLIVLEDLPALEILKLFPALARHGQVNTKRIHRFNISHVRIETDPPLWFHGDGELLGMTPVELFVVPQAIRILRPARKTNR